MLSSFSALTENNKYLKKHVSKYPLLKQDLNNFNVNEKVNLISNKINSSRLSQDSTLVSYQNLMPLLSNKHQSMRKFSDLTAVDHIDDFNYTKINSITENILALYAKYLHYLNQYRSLGDVDDLQYTILSSKFFQTNVSDINSTRRVFSIPLKESIINLKPKIKDCRNDIKETMLENNFNELSNNSLKFMHQLDTLSIVLKIRKIMKNRKYLTANKMDCLIKLFDQSLNFNTKILQNNQNSYKRYLTNFINNLDSFNHKVESFNKKGTSQQILRSCITPIMMKIIRSIEALLENNISLSSEFWSFYVPMYLGLDTNGLKRLLHLNFDIKNVEYLIKFRKLTQLFLLLLIPSNNDLLNAASLEIWEGVITNYKYTINDKGYLISKVVNMFNDINLLMKNGKSMLNDKDLLNWFEKKNVDDETYELSLRSETYEYSELLQRIPQEDSPCELNDMESKDDNSYADIQSTLNKIMLSMSMNSSISKIDSEITNLLNQWTSLKMNMGNTYNNPETQSKTPDLNHDPFKEYISTPRENADASFEQFFADDPVIENTFMENLKTLSDVELNNKLQLKLKELHIENMQDQEDKLKKASQMHLKQINLIDKREKQFLNLKEDDISSYYQLDYLKVYK